MLSKESIKKIIEKTSTIYPVYSGCRENDVENVTCSGNRFFHWVNTPDHSTHVIDIEDCLTEDEKEFLKGGGYV